MNCDTRRMKPTRMATTTAGKDLDEAAASGHLSGMSLNDAEVDSIAMNTLVRHGVLFNTSSVCPSRAPEHAEEPEHEGRRTPGHQGKAKFARCDSRGRVDT